MANNVGGPSGTLAYKIGAAAGPVGMGLFGFAVFPFIVTFLGPVPPGLPADAVAEFYRQNASAIKTGAIFGIAAATGIGAFSAAITVVLKRIEGRFSPCAYLQLAGGVLSVIGFLIPPMLWAVAAYRADRMPSEVVLLNDVAWILLVMPAWTGLLQLIPVAIAILTDRSPTPLLPRWLAYLSLWAELLFLPALLSPFFMQGPFAWNGVLSFWMAATAFSTWLIATAICLFRAAPRLAE